LAARDPDAGLGEDAPVRLQPGLPPEVTSPLAPFGGAEPPAPEWFMAAIADVPQRRMVPVAGTDIELLTWGEIGRPGLMLVHGAGAHADWWSYTAPLLAQTHRVAALSLSGMGNSGWRERYDFPIFAEEIHAAAQAAGLYEARTRPIFVGHSFGGAQVFYSAALHPERMAGAIVIDSSLGVLLSDPPAGGGPAVAPVTRTKPNPVYPTFEAALARFRLSPPQAPRSLFAADFIARRSLRPAPLPDGAGMGWTWKFDPFFWLNIERAELADLALDRAPPMVEILGENSVLSTRRKAGLAPRIVPAGAPCIAIPDSEHHVMADQPLALVASLRSVLALWPA
jgi:pimeloyl-ACP methyl ester carboxylesterase